MSGGCDKRGRRGGDADQRLAAYETAVRRQDGANPEIKSLAEAGLTARQIADELGLSINQVFDHSRAHGIDLTLQKERITVPLIREVRRCVALGMTSSMVAKVLNRSKLSVDSVRCGHGIKRPALSCAVHSRVTERCWNALVAAARHHGATSPNRVAGVCLEIMTANRLDLLPAVLPVANKAAPLASLFSPPLEARA
jgi:hypothetical protein